MTGGVILRAPRPDDLPGLTTIANLPGVRRGTLRLPFTTEAELRDRFLGDAPGRRTIVAADGDAPVGWGTLLRFAGRQSHVGDLYLAVHDERWGHGVGGRLMDALLDLADNWLGLLRVQLDVAADNARAVALYERCGFQHEGTRRGDTLTDGVFCDTHLMARLRAAPDLRHISKRD